MKPYVPRHRLEDYRSIIQAHVDAGGTDAQLGRRLNISASQARMWRRTLKIPVDKRARFLRKFREHYGRNADLELLALFADHATNTQVARVFGFTREYARQVRAKLAAL